MPNRVSRLTSAAFVAALVAGGCTAVLPPAFHTASPAASLPTGGAPSFRNDVVPVLRQHCAACHGPAGPGPFAMFDDQGNPRYEVIRARMPDMIGAVRQGRMPLGRPGAVPSPQVETLEAWQRAGAPEN